MKKNIYKGGFINPDSDLHFFVEFDTIEKGKDKNGKEVLKVGGIASTNTVDKEGETLDPNGFNFQPFLTNGYFNWHHQTKNNPMAIIGEPTAAKVTDEGFYVEGELYPENPIAQQVWQLANVLQKNSKKRRLGFSIEGKATKRNPLNPKKVEAAIITGCAITHSPINNNTLLNILKGEGSEEPPMYDLVDVTDEKRSEGNENGGYFIHMTTPDGTLVTVNKDFQITIKAMVPGAVNISENGKDEEEKALDTQSGAALRPESLDRKNKPVKVVNGDSIDSKIVEIKKDNQKYFLKSQLGLKIKSDFSDKEFSKADVDAFVTILKLLNKRSNMKNLFSQDDLQKAYAALGLDLQKGGTASMGSADGDTDCFYKKADDGDYYMKMKKSDDEDGDDERMDDEQYSKKEDGSFEKMKKSKNKVSKANDDLNLLGDEDGDGLQKGGDGSEEDDDAPILDLGNIEKAFNELQLNNNNQFKNLATILFDQNSKLEKALSENAALKERLDGLENLPVLNSTLRKAGTIKALERLQKGADQGSEDGKTLSASLQKTHVIALLDKLTFEKGFDDEFSKAMINLEGGGTLPANVINRIKAEQGITITQ